LTDYPTHAEGVGFGVVWACFGPEPDGDRPARGDCAAEGPAGHQAEWNGEDEPFGASEVVASRRRAIGLAASFARSGSSRPVSRQAHASRALKASTCRTSCFARYRQVAERSPRRHRSLAEVT
jgi:hypothetical protein